MLWLWESEMSGGETGNRSIYTLPMDSSHAIPDKYTPGHLTFT